MKQEEVSYAKLVGKFMLSVSLGGLVGRFLFDAMHYLGGFYYGFYVSVTTCYTAYITYSLICFIKENYGKSDEVSDLTLKGCTQLVIYVIGIVAVIRAIVMMVR